MICWLLKFGQLHVIWAHTQIFLSIPRLRIKSNWLSKCNHSSGVPWHLIFPVTYWFIWINRNRQLFNSIDNNHTTLLSVKDYIHRAIEWQFYWHNFTSTNAHRLWTLVGSTQLEVRWSWMWMGACTRSGKASTGGLIWEADGKWVHGFQRHIGSGTSLGAQCWKNYCAKSRNSREPFQLKQNTNYNYYKIIKQ